MRSFFATPATGWRHQAGKLHLYAIPPRAVVDHVAPYREALQRHPEIVTVQPDLHLTVQLIELHLHETGPEALDRLAGALRSRLAGLAPVSVSAGPAVVGVHAVGLYVPPPAEAFVQLNSQARAAITEALGPEVLPPPPRYAAPHITLGYGRAAADSDPLIRAVKDISTWLPPIEFTIDQVHLVAVDQHTSTGTYSWTTLDTFTLGTAEAEAAAADAQAWKPYDEHGDAPVVKLYEDRP